MNQSKPLNSYFTEPLEEVKLPGGTTISTKGLTLLVGPNSSGKTQLLKDIDCALRGDPTRKAVVAASIKTARIESISELLLNFEKQGFIEFFIDEQGIRRVKVTTTSVGSGSSAIKNGIEVSTFENWHRRYCSNLPQETQSLLSFCGALVVSSMFLLNRLTAASETNSYDYRTTQPTNDLQVLFTNSLALEKLQKEVLETFDRGIWIDPTIGGKLCFRVTNSSELPPAEERYKLDRARNFRILDDEGDGLRCFVSICMALALSQRPVCLIDEPEICLHPPQAYSLGRILGEQANKPTATIVATHSSHILRGVIQETKNVTIIRLTRIGTNFNAHSVDSAILGEAITKPLVRTELVFDGLFSDGVVLVESDGDRVVYQAIWESMQKATQLDLLFIPVNGKGAMADIAGFFHTLQIPIAIIADLDLIQDDDLVKKILEAVQCDSTETDQITSQCKKIATDVKTIPPSIGQLEVEARLDSCLQSLKSADELDDKSLSRVLRKLANDIDRARKLKNGGVEFYRPNYPNIANALDSAIEHLCEHGIFLVPVGELESWLSSEFMENGPSRERKQEWADHASKRIRHAPQGAGHLADFMSKVAGFIAGRRSNLNPAKAPQQHSTQSPNPSPNQDAPFPPSTEKHP